MLPRVLHLFAGPRAAAHSTTYQRHNASHRAHASTTKDASSTRSHWNRVEKLPATTLIDLSPTLSATTQAAQTQFTANPSSPIAIPIGPQVQRRAHVRKASEDVVEIARSPIEDIIAIDARARHSSRQRPFQHARHRHPFVPPPELYIKTNVVHSNLSTGLPTTRGQLSRAYKGEDGFLDLVRDPASNQTVRAIQRKDVKPAKRRPYQNGHAELTAFDTWTSEIPSEVSVAEDEESSETHVTVDADNSNHTKENPVAPALPRQLEKLILNVDKDRPNVSRRSAANERKRDSRSTNYALPVPSYATLHHLSTNTVANDVIALADTARYKEKFVTTVYYKPM